MAEQRPDDLQETRERLKHWGEYMRSGADVQLDYPSKAAFMKANSDQPPPLYQEDHEAWEIERILLVMKETKPNMYEVLKLEHFHQVASAEGMKRLHVSRSKYFEIRSKAEECVDFYLRCVQLLERAA